MTSRRAIVGLCMLCALVFSAIAAQSASALVGTTTVTCKKPVNGDTIIGDTVFSKEHCTKEDEGSGEFRHVVFGPKTPTTFTATNDTTGIKSPWFVHSVQAGVAEELEITEVNGSGGLENKEEGGEGYVEATGSLTFSGVSVIKPAGKGCKVKGGEFKTKELTATTKGQGMALKIAPTSGELFASFEVEGCSIGALNGVYEVKGSVTSTSINGATTKFEPGPTTELGTLKVRGQKAGISGTLTEKGRDPSIPTDVCKPLVATTQ
jgi:hypothetical protein